MMDNLVGTAKASGFIVATGSNGNRGLKVYVNGIFLGVVVHRDYGMDISCTVPINKGDTYEVSGTVSRAYFIAFR